MGERNSWLAPLLGVAFIVLVIVGFAVGGEPPDPDESTAEEIVGFYADNNDEVVVGSVVQTIAATLFVFFGAYLWRVLRDADQRGGAAALATFAGIVIFALAVAIDGTINFAAAETVESVDPAATQALAALWSNDFLPLGLGLQVFLLGLGSSVVRWGALPKWVGYIALVLGVIAVTPIGFVSFIGAGLLVLVISVMLTLRARSQPPATGPGTPHSAAA